jgi:tripartite ATP-independent transporter DctM subunit
VALNLLTLAARDAVAGEIFAVIPLFVLMGLLVAISDIGRDSYALAARLFAAVRGGLGMATVGANAMFAAITGISIASAAVFSRIAVPEMTAMGYGRRFSVGVVAGSSVLGMLIPPSILMILYAFVTEQSVGAMFLAGILPGLTLAAAFIVAIALMARFWPRFVGGPTRETPFRPAGDAPGTAALVLRLGPAAGLILLVLGGIYLGLFTATEAGAVGALALLLLTAAQGRLTWHKLWNVMVETGQISAAILFLVIASSMYSRLLGVSGLPTQIGNWIGGAELSLVAILLVYVIIVLLLGFLLDAASIILVVVPLFLPVLAPYDVNLIWFGVVTIIAVEIGLLTPPLGLSCYVIKAALDDDRIGIVDVFAGALPFAGVMLAVLALVMAVPWLSLAFL